MFAAAIGKSRPKRQEVTKMEHRFQELHVPGHCGFITSFDRIITSYLGIKPRF